MEFPTVTHSPDDCLFDLVQWNCDDNVGDVSIIIAPLLIPIDVDGTKLFGFVLEISAKTFLIHKHTMITSEIARNWTHKISTF